MVFFWLWKKSYFGHKLQCSNTASLFYEVPAKNSNPRKNSPKLKEFSLFKTQETGNFRATLVENTQILAPNLLL